MCKFLNRSKKAVVVAGLVVVGSVAPVFADSSSVTVQLPALDLVPLMTWIIGLSGTILAIGATIFAVRKANRFLGG